MAIEISRNMDFHFDSDMGEQNAFATVTFSGHVNGFVTVLRRFEVSFANGDHHLGRLMISTEGKPTQLDDTTVVVTVRYLLRDFSDNIDNPFQGDIGVNVIADVG